METEGRPNMDPTKNELDPNNLFADAPKDKPGKDPLNPEEFKKEPEKVGEVLYDTDATPNETIVETGGLAGALEPDEAVPHEIHDETAGEIHHPFENSISEAEAGQAVKIGETTSTGDNPTIDGAAKAIRKFEEEENEKGKEIDKLLEKINRMPN